jgi:DNA replication protein DnaC
MLTTNLIDTLLLQLKLHGIQTNLPGRMKQALDEKLGPEDLLGLLLHDEAEYRKNARIDRLLRAACMRTPASLEAFDWSVPRGLDKKVVNDLATCRFVRDGHTVIVMGPTGVGKSFIASALGNAACRHGHSTFFYRMNGLIEQMGLARAKGTYLNLVKKLGGCDLLVLDDFGIKPLTPQQYQDLYDILDERSEGRATIVTSQLPIANWNEVIGDPVTCEAITDRLAARAVKIIMRGESYRRRRPTKGEPDGRR